MKIVASGSVVSTSGKSGDRYDVNDAGGDHPVIVAHLKRPYCLTHGSYRCEHAQFVLDALAARAGRRTRG